MTGRTAARNRKSGSPRTGEPEYLVVGLLRRPHGVVGDILMEVITDFPERLRPDLEVFTGTEHRRRIIQATRQHAAGMLIRFQDVSSPERAGRLRNQLVYVRASNRPKLPAGIYYHHELIGLEVVDEHEVSLGTLSEIIQTGANDVYAVDRAAGGELLLPAIAEVILGIDKARRRIKVRVPAGILAEGQQPG